MRILQKIVWRFRRFRGIVSERFRVQHLKDTECGRQKNIKIRYITQHLNSTLISIVSSKLKSLIQPLNPWIFIVVGHIFFILSWTKTSERRERESLMMIYNWKSPAPEWNMRNSDFLAVDDDFKIISAIFYVRRIEDGDTMRPEWLMNFVWWNVWWDPSRLNMSWHL